MQHARVEIKAQSPSPADGQGVPPRGGSGGMGGEGGGAKKPRRGLWGYWMKRPVATLLLALAIWLCVRSIPAGISADPPGAPSARVAGGRAYTPNPWAYLVRAADGSIVAIEPGKETPRDKIIGNASFAYRLRPEREMWSVQLHADLKPGEEPAARKAFADWLATSPHKYWRNMAKRLSLQDDVDTIGYMGLRIVLVTIALGLGGLLVRSLVWAEPILEAIMEPMRRMSMDPEERERRRRRKALAAGKCPGCGYAIVGLPKRRCPECNETWGAWELK